VAVNYFGAVELLDGPRLALSRARPPRRGDVVDGDPDAGEP